MAKLGQIKQYGNQFVMEVELEGGHKERWTYVRQEHDGFVSYSMIDREDA